MSVVVASAKGGVGKSSFCIGVGKNLAVHGHKTLLIDMDIGVRSLDLLSGVAEKTVYNWGDIIKGNCDTERAVIEISANLSLLAAPFLFEDCFTPENLLPIINELEKQYEFILLDAPAGIERGFFLAGAVSKSCIIITTPDPVSVRAATGAADALRENGRKNLRLIVNRFDKKKKTDVCIDDIIDGIGARLLGIVPESKEISELCMGKKIPYDCKGNLALVRIANRICGENIPLKIKNL